MTLSLKVRDKIKKTFGDYMFNYKVKIPIYFVMVASWTMGRQSCESFWNEIIRQYKEKGKNENTNK